MAPKKKSDQEKFWPKVQKTSTCWLWTACKTKLGYGKLSWKQAHRVSWEIHNGAIPVGMCVCHKCDNPPCVNPDHLFLGTQKDNILDAKKKGRLIGKGKKYFGDDHWTHRHPEWIATGDKSGQRLHPERFPTGDDHWTRKKNHLVLRHENNPRAKLKNTDIPTIKNLYTSGVSQPKIGVQYGVSQAVISSILRGKTWKNLPANPDV